MTVKFREDTGKWQAVLNNKELFGNKRPAKSFRVKKDAERWERDQIREAEQGRHCAASKDLFADVLKEFIANCWERTEGRNPDLDAQTVKDYAQIAKAIVAPMLGQIRVDRVTTADVQRLVDAAKQKFASGNPRTEGSIKWPS